MIILFPFSLLDVVLNNPLYSVSMDTQMEGVLESFRNNSVAIGKLVISYDHFFCQLTLKSLQYYKFVH